MIRFVRLFRSFLNLKWRVKPPSQRNVLLYFKTGSEVIAPYFSPEEFQVLDLRESEVNLFIVLKCLVDRDLSATNYAQRFVEFAQPKLILTFIDNFPPFYLLKDQFPNIHTLLVQNGIRSNRGDLFGLLSSQTSSQQNKCDSMFVFGSSVGAKYLEYIKGNLIIHGSFKNNLSKKVSSIKNTVAYISTYRPNLEHDFIVPESALDNPISYHEIISRREQVVLWLANYCVRHNQYLTIIGKHEQPDLEESYYRKVLKDFKFSFVARSTSTTSYTEIDHAEIVVFTSSTLGYESLARGNKTAAIMLDAKIIGAEALKFGWPEKLVDEGQFWTHQLNETRFIEIMDYLRTVSDSEWSQLRSEVIKNIISYDPDNSQFVKLVNALRASWQ